MITAADLARLVDHTLLKPEATPAQVDALCADARTLGVFSVCVSPTFVERACATLAASGADTSRPAVCTVVGFPSGKHLAEIKAAEARAAVEQGADEIDMVIDVGALRAGDAGDAAATRREIEAVRAACEGRLLKVIIESAALADAQIVAACEAAEAAGADFVKTSTGFHPAGGASVAAVALMRRTVGDRLGVKASGGIRTWDDAVAMVEAGASRLGLSATADVLAAAPA